MTLELKEYLYVLRLSRTIISVLYLTVNDDFEFKIKGDSCLIILNDMVYGSASLKNGLLVLNPDMPLLNINLKIANNNKSK